MKLIVAFFLLIPSAFAASGDPTCTKGPATLRKGPGPNFPVSWKVPKFMPFLRFEAKGGWVKVRDLDGETHWMQPRDLTSGIQCVVVKSLVATLRQSASGTAPPAEIKTVDRFTPLKKLEGPGEWIHVEDEAGHQSWIHETNVWKPVRIQVVDF